MPRAEWRGQTVPSIRQLRKTKLRPRWFRIWNPELDAALERMPESECCPHELYRLLCDNADSSVKRFAIVEDRGGEPVAVVGLRWRSNQWVPLTHYTIPGMVFPVKEGMIGELFPVLGSDISVAWWRMGEFNVRMKGISGFLLQDTYAIDFSGRYEEYWRESNQMRPIRRSRKRCEGLDVRINAEGMAEWVTRAWEEKWRANAEPARSDLEDKVLAVKYLERRGKYFTLTLHEDGKPLGGHTFLAHEGSLVWHYTYRDSQYEQLGVGTYLMDYAVQWGRASGFRGIDLGGDYPENKKRWGAVGGTKVSLHIGPRPNLLVTRAKQFLEKVRSEGLGRACLVAGRRIVDRMKLS